MNNVRPESCHFYDRDGTPHHWVPKKRGTGNRPTNITDAKEHGWLPSVTTVLSVINKPNLERWKMLQACMAVLTSPRKEGEGLDAFMERVLFEDEEQKAEAKAAADKGSAIHNAIELAVQGLPFEDQWKPYVQAVFPVIEGLGKIAWCEKVLIGDGYAGRCDIGIHNERHLVLLDFKSTKKLPNESYPEHRLQLSAYAKANGNTGNRHILTGNLYLSTTNPGHTSLCLHDEWELTYEMGFRKVLEFWQFMNKYYPKL